MNQTQAVGESLLCTALIAAAALKTPYPKSLTALATAAVSGWRIYHVKEPRWRGAVGIGNGLTHLADIGILLGMSRLLRRIPSAGLLPKIGAGLGCALWATARIGSEALFEGQYTIGGAIVDLIRTRD